MFKLIATAILAAAQADAHEDAAPAAPEAAVQTENEWRPFRLVNQSGKELREPITGFALRDPTKPSAAIFCGDDEVVVMIGLRPGDILEDINTSSYLRRVDVTYALDEQAPVKERWQFLGKTTYVLMPSARATMRKIYRSAIAGGIIRYSTKKYGEAEIDFPTLSPAMLDSFSTCITDSTGDRPVRTP